MKDWKFLPNNLKENEQKAFEHVFHALYPRLCSFAFQYLKSEAAAEDVVSEVMFNLWKKKGAFDDFIVIKSYLYISVKNKSITYLNKKALVLRHSKEVTLHQDTDFFQDNLIKDELTGLLFQALEKLPEKAKEVFTLSCMEGMKYKDIAEDLGITVNTVKSQRARAIKLLKEILKEEVIWVFFLGLLK